MNTEYSALVPFEIDRATPMCQNYKHDLRTQVFSTFRAVSATDQEVGSNHCRDEKRTERSGCSACRNRASLVATIAAMKSGLKVPAVAAAASSGAVATIAAMKSGLKGRTYRSICPIRPRSNHCRDEKRTERRINNAYRQTVISSNHCRDEKRTERLLAGVQQMMLVPL